MKRRSPRFFSSADDGAVTIEFVCTLPLFLAALAFAFEFGQYFLAHQSTVHNVRAASRYLSRVDLSCPGNCSVRNAAFNDAVDLIRTGQTFGTSAPSYLEDACQQVTDCIETFDSSTRGRIQVRVSYQPLLFGFIGASSLTLPFVVREDFAVVGM